MPLRSSKSTGFALVALAAFGLIAAAMPLAAGDNVHNSIDSDAAGIREMVAGGNVAVAFHISATASDGQRGCNAADTTAATLTLDVPTGVTASRTQLEYVQCGTGAAQSVTFATTVAGDHAIRVSVSDQGAGTYDVKADFILRVLASDSTPPILTLPASFAVAAAADHREQGTQVQYAASAEDAEDGVVSIQCSPASGTVHPIGATTVECSALDAALNRADGSFTITVEDRTAPVLTLPAPTVSAAADHRTADGTLVAYAASALDNVDGAVVTLCSPASSTLYPIGATTVECSAEDAAANVAAGSFTITVEDRTGPTIAQLANLERVATSARGATAEYAPSAEDNVDGPVTPGCDRESGSTFPLGTTTVTCSATDVAGNAATAMRFTVRVTYAYGGIQQPINADGSSSFKAGSTVPVKFRLAGDSGGIPDATARLTVRQLSNNPTGSEAEATSTSAATSGNLFRYDALADQYIFNWGTKNGAGTNLATGDYILRIDLGDGNPRETRVSLRR